MKVLHVIDSEGVYGAEVLLLGLMEEQIRLGLKPILCSLGENTAGEKPLEAEAAARKLVVKKVRVRRGPDLGCALRVASDSRADGVDLLHLHGYKGNILFGLLPRWLRRLPLVTTLHGWTSSGGASRIRVYEWLDSKVLLAMDRVVLVSRAMLEHPKLRGRSRLRIAVIPNAVRPCRTSESLDERLLTFCGQAPTIGCIGRLSPEKGHDVLLRAFHTLIVRGFDLNLLLLGDGPERPRLEALIQALGLGSRVLLAGYVKDACGYLPRLALFVLPSYTEGLPVSILEAMEAGIPVVGTNVGGVPELLDYGSRGRLVNPGDVQGLSETIERLLDDPAGARSLRENAKQAVSTQFSTETMARRYWDVYREVVGVR